MEDYKKCSLTQNPVSAEKWGKHRHHPDYDKPFEIVWLCSSCHRREHQLGKTKRDKNAITEALYTFLRQVRVRGIRGVRGWRRKYKITKQHKAEPLMIGV
jgi:hypothetical protein